MKNNASYRIGEMLGSCLFFVGLTAIIFKVKNRITKTKSRDYTMISIGLFVFSCVNFAEVISERNQWKPVIDNILHNLYLSRNIPIETDNEIANLLNNHIDNQKELFEQYYQKTEQIKSALSPNMLSSKKDRTKNLLLINDLEKQLDYLYNHFYKANQELKDKLIAKNVDNELIEGIKKGENEGRDLFDNFKNNQKNIFTAIKDIIYFCNSAKPVATETNILFKNNDDLEKYTQLLKKVFSLSEEEEKIMNLIQDKEMKRLEKLKQSL
jgi:hypothetical protein